MLLISEGNPVNPDSDNKLAKILTYLALPRIKTSSYQYAILFKLDNSANPDAKHEQAEILIYEMARIMLFYVLKNNLKGND